MDDFGVREIVKGWRWMSRERVVGGRGSEAKGRGGVGLVRV